MTLSVLIYWFTVIRDAVISAKLFQTQSYCWILSKETKQYNVFMLVQRWAQNKSLWETNLIVIRWWNEQTGHLSFQMFNNGSEEGLDIRTQIPITLLSYPYLFFLRKLLWKWTKWNQSTIQRTEEVAESDFSRKNKGQILQATSSSGTRTLIMSTCSIKHKKGF